MDGEGSQRLLQPGEIRLARSVFGNRLVSYRYHLNGRPLRRYSMEQQAQIIADYFILKTYGYASWMALRARGDVTLDGDLRESRMLPEYQKTLQGFPWC